MLSYGDFLGRGRELVVFVYALAIYLDRIEFLGKRTGVWRVDE